MFSLYGFIALCVSLPFSPYKDANIPLKSIFPPNYRMFVKPAKVYTTLDFVYYNKGENDSVRLDYSNEIQERLEKDFPFNATAYYYYRTLLFSSHKFDFFKNMNSYLENNPEFELNARKNNAYNEVLNQTPFFKKSLLQLSDDVKDEYNLKRYNNVVVRVKANSILPKYDMDYYNENEYIYSLPETRTVIELKK